MNSHKDVSRYSVRRRSHKPTSGKEFFRLAVIRDFCPVKFRFAGGQALPATMPISCNCRIPSWCYTPGT